MNMNAETKEDLFDTVWDLYREVHGVRPRWMASELEHMSVEDLKLEIKILTAQAETLHEEERIAEAKAIFSLENRIRDLIGMGASDRETAIRWLDAAEETNGDMNYLCYCLGVPYGYFNEITEKK